MSAEPKNASTGWRMFGCAGAIIVGVVALIGGLVISASSLDLGFFDFSIDSDPGEGTDSARLPVEVTPRTGLADDTLVTVTSEAFDPYDVVGVAVCLAEAASEALGVDACDEVKGVRYAVASDGRLSATYRVPRVITIGGVAHDCAAFEAQDCLVVAASAGDYDRSGGQPISFRTDLGAADLTPSTVRAESDLLPVIPPDAGALSVGSSVAVTASGYQPGEPVLMAHCAGFPREPITSCDAISDSTAMAAIMFRSVRGVSDTADETGTITFTFNALASIEPTFSASGDGIALDCTNPATGCAFVIAAAADTKRSAVVPYVVSR